MGGMSVTWQRQERESRKKELHMQNTDLEITWPLQGTSSSHPFGELVHLTPSGNRFKLIPSGNSAYNEKPFSSGADREGQARGWKQRRTLGAMLGSCFSYFVISQGRNGQDQVRGLRLER